jgi:hypothetical protein
VSFRDNDTGVHRSLFQKGLLYGCRESPEYVSRAEMNPLGGFQSGGDHGLPVKFRQINSRFFPLGIIGQVFEI